MPSLQQLNSLYVFTVTLHILCKWTSKAHSEMQFWLLRWRHIMQPWAVASSVDWLFADIINYFKFLDFKKNFKVGLSSIGKMFIIYALLRNNLTCLYGNNTSEFFQCETPKLFYLLCIKLCFLSFWIPQYQERKTESTEIVYSSKISYESSKLPHRVPTKQVGIIFAAPNKIHFLYPGACFISNNGESKMTLHKQHL